MKKSTFISKIMSTIMAILIFISLCSTTIMGFSYETTGSSSVGGQEKIAENLKVHLETTTDDYVPITIWLTSCDDDILYQVISKKLGTTITPETEESYISNKIATKVNVLNENLSSLYENSDQILSTIYSSISLSELSVQDFKMHADIPSIMTDSEIEDCIKSGMSGKEIISISEKNSFLHEYRQSRKYVNNSIVSNFCEVLDSNNIQDIFSSHALPVVSLKCKKSYIDVIANMAQVDSIYLTTTEEYLTEETHISSVEEISLAEYHMTQQYSKSGAGIKIGVLETGEGESGENIIRPTYFDDEDLSLNGKNIVTNVPSTNAKSSHATDVLSIVGGNEITCVNGSTYSGIAPNASLFYTNLDIYDETPLDEALNWLVVENDVNIVTMSFGKYLPVGQNTVYTSNDKTVDEYVQEYRVLCVVSAGNVNTSKNNTGQITSPAYSYNSITVGNSISTGIMNSSSCYIHESYLTNKPDLVAIGTNIYMAESSHLVSCMGSGTSFAAPQVAGAAALMMQANPALVGKPDTVKAILLNSADETAISSESTTDENGNTFEENSIVSSFSIPTNNTKLSSAYAFLREKSGAGLLNIETAIRMSNSNLFYDYIITSNLDNVTTDTFYFPAGATIEFGLVYEICNNSDTQTDPEVNDIDIRILDANDNIIFTSTDYINNVEMFKCTFAQGGEYRFRIFCWDTDAQINTTLILSCGCKDKILSHSDYEKTQHKVSCDSVNGCGFVCYEKHRLATVTKSLSNDGASVTFNVYYAFEKVNLFERELLYYDFSTSCQSSSTLTVHGLSVGTGGYTQTTATGEIRRYNYEAIIEQNGVVSFVDIGGVTITIDYYDKTVTLKQ